MERRRVGEDERAGSDRNGETRAKSKRHRQRSPPPKRPGLRLRSSLWWHFGAEGAEGAEDAALTASAWA